MGAAFYLSLDKEVAGIDPTCDIDGKLLSKVQEKLDKAAPKLNVKPLMSYFSVGAEAQEFLKEEGFADSVEIPAETWFDPSEGLLTVRAFINHVKSDSSSFKNADGVMTDLQAMERVLAAANEAGAKFHLSIDF